VALPRDARDGRSRFGRNGRPGLIVQHPAADLRSADAEARAESGPSGVVPVLESRLRDEARLEGVRLAAREIAHLVNNDLAVAVGFVDLLQDYGQLPVELLELLENAASSLDAAARHIQQLQSVDRIVIKATPAGESLDLEQSQRDRPRAATSQLP
jgi:signal transduction histidine kinase